MIDEHDDKRLDQPIRYGQWPRATEAVIKQLWHRCVALAAEKAEHNATHREIHRKLSVAAGGVIVGSLAVPLLLEVLHLINTHEFDHLWHYGTYLAAAGLGLLIAGWWTSD